MRILKNLFKKEFFKKDIASAACLALVFCIVLTLAGFDSKCEQLRDKVLRLHILANSDSEQDQALKLKVRDSILKVSDGMFDNLESKDSAMELIEKNTEVFEKIAINTIKKCGYDYPVSISVGKAYFDTRVYDNFTLPAGEYDAVRVLIGKAEGKNWWCVMFPSLCIPAAEKEHKLTEAVDEKSAEIAENAPRYEMRFKVVEWYESFKNKLKSIF